MIDPTATINVGGRQPAFDQRGCAQPQIGVKIHLPDRGDIVHRYQLGKAHLPSRSMGRGSRSPDALRLRPSVGKRCVIERKINAGGFARQIEFRKADSA